MSHPRILIRNTLLQNSLESMDKHLPVFGVKFLFYRCGTLMFSEQKSEGL